ncbi:uncharacterized protein LOC107403301 [Ziziphus jujuba]|uniref:Uncharacterized protein LOC107403301 n=1 Tax=Ziziphus jujuba TaxID=326968 RepID=A0ABM4AC13_ZIZJJ|nr:uncharacterized protein LOC107403301 [Ziziphus jujuba]
MELHIKASVGPRFALIQRTLETVGTSFKKIPTEDCPTIRRGSVAWIGSGPELFISLANHEEWKNSYTVFGSVTSTRHEFCGENCSSPHQTRCSEQYRICARRSCSIGDSKNQNQSWRYYYRCKNRLTKV